MKTLLAKTLATTAFALLSLQSVQAANDSRGPWPATAEDKPWLSPATIQYLEQRAAAIAAESRQSNNPFPSASEEHPRNFSPDQLRYFDQREAAIGKELKERPMQSNYRPQTSNVRER